MDYRQRVEQVQQDLRQEIVDKACSLFLVYGIGPVKMTDVAREADVGVASLYRWFGGKKELVILAGIRLWQKVGELLDGIFTSEVYQQKSGYEQASDLLKLFLAAYTGHAPYLRFLQEFDRFAANEHITPDELQNYEKSILDLQPLVRDAYDKGLSDGSIRRIDFDSFYFSATHALMSLSQKLVCTGTLLHSDQQISGETQLQAVMDMFLYYLKSEPAGEPSGSRLNIEEETS